MEVLMHRVSRPIFVAFSGLLLLALSNQREDPNINHDRFCEGAELHIYFAGLICHVFDPDHAPRAVILRGTASMPHRAVLTLSEHQIESTEVSLSCSDDKCNVDLENTALRFALGGNATFEASGSFDVIVPHLKAITNGEMNALREEVFDEVPSPESRMAAYIKLPAGLLTAVPFAQNARFEPDYEKRGLRPFPEGVFLTGYVQQPVLLMRRLGDKAWRRIVFRTDDGIDIGITNEPTSGVGSPMHAMLYYGLAREPLAVEPVIAASERSARMAPLFTVPGCNNTQFP
jgi:hypothetical protein